MTERFTIYDARIKIREQADEIERLQDEVSYLREVLKRKDEYIIELEERLDED